jgi:2-(3-amino-3-carboxypropyl)histidine synthase
MTSDIMISQYIQSKRGRLGIGRHILENKELNEAIEFSLPRNYDFEIHKTLWRIEQTKAQHIGLQFPEGLLMFSIQIASILLKFSSHPIQTTILGDVTYGACCIDDLSALSIGIDLLIHYGHSCLIPVTQLALKNCLYIFVDIFFDYRPLVQLILKKFCTNNVTESDNASFNNALNKNDSSAMLIKETKEPFSLTTSSVISETNILQLHSLLPSHRPLTVALMGTIQFSSVIFSVQKALQGAHITLLIPQELPLTSGEVLGCTSPKIHESVDVVIFIADGRFHLESVMIQNPHVLFFRYDPFNKKLFREQYNHEILHRQRQQAISEAQKAVSVGLILGTLGRQGSVGIFEKIQQLLRKRNIRTILLLMSEINVQRLETLSLAGKIDAFIQVSCPRLSIDWGHSMCDKPLLTPYEAFVTFGNEPYQKIYPMDYYSTKGGAWTNFHENNRQGSLSNDTSTKGPFSDLQQRRELIRKRAEARKMLQNKESQT